MKRMRREAKAREATVIGDREWCNLHLQDSATTFSTRYKAIFFKLAMVAD
jgi:hypothetical protein